MVKCIYYHITGLLTSSTVPVCNPRPLEERSLYTKPEGSFSSNVKDLACLMLKHYASGSVYAE